MSEDNDVRSPVAPMMIELREVKSENPCKNRLKRMKEKRQEWYKKRNQEESEEIADVREPKIKNRDYVLIYKIFGWNWILIFLGAIGSCGAGKLLLHH